MTHSGIAGIKVVVTIDDWYDLGWWFAGQSSDDQAEFLSGMSHHMEDGFTDENAPHKVTPGDLQLMWIADGVQAKTPVTRRRIRAMLVTLLERIPE